MNLVFFPITTGFAAVCVQKHCSDSVTLLSVWHMHNFKPLNEIRLNKYIINYN